jgi:N-hydroxyarylamine O-acetyltransferase
MSLNPESIRAYLDRIAYRGSVEPNIDTLRALHWSHLRSVPFENLDIHLGRPIIIDEARFFDKIVKRRRGGFCYELNGMFGALLRELGFDVTLLSARVANDSGGFGQEYDHLTLLVKLDEPWLADVGFGDSFVEPLRLDANVPQKQGNSEYQIEQLDGIWILRRRRQGNDWSNEYAFTLTPRRLEEFEGMCRYHQTSPLSTFTRKRVCSLATAGGRLSLSDTRLIQTHEDTREERQLAGEFEYVRTLRDLFGVELGD